MARRSRMSMLKRQREIQKAEKAARKRAKRHGTREVGFEEPRATLSLVNLPDLSSAQEEGKEEASEADAEVKEDETETS